MATPADAEAQEAAKHLKLLDVPTDGIRRPWRGNGSAPRQSVKSVQRPRTKKGLAARQVLGGVRSIDRQYPLTLRVGISVVVVWATLARPKVFGCVVGAG